VRYPGTTWFTTHPNSRIPLINIQGISASRNPELVLASEQSESDLAVLHQFCMEMIAAVRAHSDSWPFEEPVRAEDAPDYYEVIKDPIDLQTIQQRAETGNYYITKDIFFADFRRMCDNCKLYNKEDTVYYKCATSIEKLLRDRGGAEYMK
jgi:hypothetical protein